MAFDFFTIQNLATELDELMSGATITRAYSIGGPGSAPDSGERPEGGRIPDLALSWGSDFHLASWVGRGGGVCIVPGGIPAAMRQTTGPERYLSGATVDRVRAERCDRMIRIGLWRQDASGARSCAELLLELVEPHVQAVLKSEQTQCIVACWRGRGVGVSRIVKGEPYTPIPGPQRLVPGEAELSDFCQRARAEPTRTLVRALGTLLAGADRGIAMRSSTALQPPVLWPCRTSMRRP